MSNVELSAEPVEGGQKVKSLYANCTNLHEFPTGQKVPAKTQIAGRKKFAKISAIRVRPALDVHIIISRYDDFILARLPLPRIMNA